MLIKLAHLHSIESISSTAQKATISANASTMGAVSGGGYTAIVANQSPIFTVPYVELPITQGDIGLIIAVLGLLLSLVFGVKRHRLERERLELERDIHRYNKTGRHPHADEREEMRY